MQIVIDDGLFVTDCKDSEEGLQVTSLARGQVDLETSMLIPQCSRTDTSMRKEDQNFLTKVHTFGDVHQSSPSLGCYLLTSGLATIFTRNIHSVSIFRRRLKRHTVVLCHSFRPWRMCVSVPCKREISWFWNPSVTTLIHACSTCWDLVTTRKTSLYHTSWEP